MQMDIQVRIQNIISHRFCSRNQRSSSFSSSPHSSFKSLCSRRDSQESQQNGDNKNRDWDKAWSSFRKQGRKTLFSKFSPDKYVSWNPRRSEFPLSEEVDPIKRTERSNLKFWNSTSFTLVGAIIIVSFLLLYTILAPVK